MRIRYQRNIDEGSSREIDLIFHHGNDSEFGSGLYDNSFNLLFYPSFSRNLVLKSKHKSGVGESKDIEKKAIALPLVLEEKSIRFASQRI